MLKLIGVVFLVQGLDVLVHRGIYEAAKGIYEQMLLEVRAHLKSCNLSFHRTFSWWEFVSAHKSYVANKK